MSKAPRKAPRKAGVKPAAASASAPSDSDLDEVLRLIDEARARALTAANTALIDLYWSLGEYISRRIDAEGWGHGTVKALAERIARRRPNARGLLGPESLADAAVLRDLSRPARTLIAAERIVLDA